MADASDDNELRQPGAPRHGRHARSPLRACPQADAATAAEVLVRTSLRGIDTHGISRVPLYVEAMLEGRINPRPDHGGEFRDGILYYRGDHGLGQAVGVAAVRAAMELAKDPRWCPASRASAGIWQRWAATSCWPRRRA